MADAHARQPRLAGRYGLVAAGALLALAPYIVLTTALPLLQTGLAASLHTSKLAVQTGEGLSNAGYALGAVFGAYLAQRVRLRPAFLATEVGFIAASVLAAASPAATGYIIGRSGQGLATGLMLVLALPPLITAFPASRLPRTAGLVNVGLFGAVTAGPLLGGWAGDSGGNWRVLFAGVAVAGALGLLLGMLALRREPARNPEVPTDRSAFALAAAATVLPFFAVSRLVSVSVSSPLVLAPLAGGLAALVSLIVRQYRHRDALMPVKALSSALPIIGTGAAMVAGAGVIALMSLTATALLMVEAVSPLHAGLLLTPELGGLVVAAVTFAAVLRTRWLAVLIGVGMACVVAAGVLLLAPAEQVRVALGTALLGLGAGWTVSPGLFLAAFGVESSKLGRAFALVELLRSEAAYLVAPVLLFVAMDQASLSGGLRLAVVCVLGLVAIGLVTLGALYLASGVHTGRPDLEGWLAGDGQALHSPPPAEPVRHALASAPGGRHAA